MRNHGELTDERPEGVLAASPHATRRAMLAGLPFLSLILILACTPNIRRASNTTTNAPPSSATNPNASPTEFQTRAVNEQGTGQFDRYQFTYRQAGESVMVSFAPVHLPWRDLTVVGAAREIIRTVYGDNSENFPRPVEWNYEGERTSAIKLEGNVAEYVFVPLRDEMKTETREIRALVCWKLAKGTLR